LDSINRNDAIHEKGFDMTQSTYKVYGNEETEFKSIRVGLKKLEDAVLDVNSMKECLCGHRFINKRTIYEALAHNDLRELRHISNFFYNTSGIYQKLCNYIAYMYRYDWYVVPEIYDDSVKEEKILKDFSRILNYLDNSYIKKNCGDIALEIVKNGAYYAYIVPSTTGLVLQQLPVDRCRSRYSVNGFPAVEFDMRYFDTFSDPAYRMKVLKLFPDEFAKGYMLYKQGKLTPDFLGDNHGSWYLLDPKSTVKFNLNNSDIPLFVNAIPSIIDLDSAQAIDRKKQAQQLLKIIVQKLPLDKNGDLIFDVDEARDIHNNAVDMLKNTIGTDVLTTFTDVDSIDLSDTNSSSGANDTLERVERTVYNATGVSKNLFNTTGNLSLEKSILDDESNVRNLLLQFSMFFDRVTQALNVNKKKYNFKLYMLETTQYNYQALSKLYKEQTQIGYSKMLPQIALGHSQSFILNTAHFENEVLCLSEIMIPPLMSSTLNGEDVLGKKATSDTNKTQTNSGTKKVTAETKAAGRPEKANDEKSDKTIANKESST
jgi:hypothetical protein